MIVSGNTDIAVADFDYAAAFPWMTDGVPETFQAAAEWAHDALGDERVAWLRRLPAERRAPRRRRHDDPRLPRLARLADGGLRPGARPDRHHSSGSSRTDARVIACGHTHLPEVRDLGWKLIVNDGSAGYVFDGDPTASWALHRPRRRRGHGRDQADRVRRARRRQRDLRPRPAGRRLPRGHRPHGEAGPMTDASPGRRDRDGHGHGARQRRRRRTWDGLVAGRSGVRTIEAFDPSRLTSRIAGEVRDFDASHVLDRKDHAPDRPLHPVRARRGARGARPGRPAGALRGRARRADRGHPRDRARRRRDAHRRLLDQRPARPGPDQPVPHPDGHPQRRRRPGRHQLRDDRPELHDGVGLRDRRPRASASRREIIRRGDADIMVAGGAEAGDLRGARRRVRRDARAVDAERRPDGRVAAVRLRAATGSSSARAPAS